ncbi:MAG: TIR domain-containing protein [Chloroflexota bacterium]
MAQAFISYSHDDSEFGRLLHAALIGKTIDVWMDWEDIPSGERWWNEISEGIGAADNFVTIVSEHSMASAMCHMEIEYARRNNKRIIPILLKKTDENVAFVNLVTRKISDYQRKLLGDRDLLQIARDNWGVLAELNWIIFEDASFDVQLQELINTFNSDAAYKKEHTRLLLRAREWQRHGSLVSWLLHDEELLAAEEWRAQSTTDNLKPPLTTEHDAYIDASRRAQDERQRQIEAQRRKLLELAAAEAQARAAAEALKQETLNLKEAEAAARAIVKIRDRQILSRTVVTVCAVALVVVAIIAANILQNTANQVEQRANAAEVQVAQYGATMTAIPPTVAAISQISLYNLAVVNRQQSFYDDAIAQLQDVLAQGRFPLATLELARIYRSFGQDDEAMAMFQSYVDDPNDSTLPEYVEIEIASMYIDQGDLETANAILQGLVNDAETVSTYIKFMSNHLDFFSLLKVTQAKLELARPVPDYLQVIDDMNDLRPEVEACLETFECTGEYPDIVLDEVVYFLARSYAATDHVADACRFFRLDLLIPSDSVDPNWSDRRADVVNQLGLLGCELLDETQTIS